MTAVPVGPTSVARRSRTSPEGLARFGPAMAAVPVGLMVPIPAANGAKIASFALRGSSCLASTLATAPFRCRASSEDSAQRLRNPVTAARARRSDPRITYNTEGLGTVTNWSGHLAPNFHNFVRWPSNFVRRLDPTASELGCFVRGSASPTCPHPNFARMARPAFTLVWLPRPKFHDFACWPSFVVRRLHSTAFTLVRFVQGLVT